MAYVTVQDARDAGVPSSFTPEQIQPHLDLWSKFMDDATRQWFEPRFKQLLLDGNNARVLFLPVPIISVDAVYINGNFVDVVPPDYYTVYNVVDGMRDDRRNPMIKFSSFGLGIYDTPDFRYAMRFVIGTNNQRIDGKFGFVEPDGTTPAMIKRAVLKLTIRALQRGPNLWGEILAGPIEAGKKTSETTDGHTVTYNAYAVNSRQQNLNGITNDDEVDNIINLYKAPLKITSTSGRGGYDSRW